MSSIDCYRGSCSIIWGKSLKRFSLIMGFGEKTMLERINSYVMTGG